VTDRITRLATYRPAQVAQRPPCQASCAVSGEVRDWIGIVAQRHQTGLDDAAAISRAWERIAEVNPFPAILGRVCPHPCEAGCNRNDKDSPIAINALERFLGDWGIEHDLALPVITDGSTGRSVGVVGAGPAGLSFAYQMARRGHAVTVYEGRAQPGGMLRFGIPDFRLPQEVLDAEVSRIADLGVEFRFGHRIGDRNDLDALIDSHDALFVGIGAGVGRRLGIPGEDAAGVFSGIEFLDVINRGGSVDLGDTVVVVGGGNTAVDTARAARRTGARVVLVYRRTRAEMPAEDIEVEEAIDEGIELRFLESPIEVRVAEGRVVGVVVQQMRLGEPDASGRARPEPIDGGVDEIPAQSLLVAVAQSADLGLLGGAAELVPGSGAAEIEPGVWIGGDAVEASIAGAAILQGRTAAEAVHASLMGLPLPERDAPDPITGDSIAFHQRPDSSRAAVEVVPAALALAEPGLERTTTITKEQFLAEVERCFSCGLCFGCSQCFMYCTVGTFTMLADPQPGAYFAMDLAQCTECGKCIEVCPCGYLTEAAAPVSVSSE
jgi:formate dehydrogenase major subunit